VQDWLQQSERAAQWALTRASADTPSKAQAAPASAATTPAPTPPSDVGAPVAKRKLSYKEQRELDALPGTIAALEAEHTKASAQLADGSLYVKDPALATQLATRIQTIDDELLAAMERMEALGG
jgi:ABC transport system ATP-binding/permease protein